MTAAAEKVQLLLEAGRAAADRREVLPFSERLRRLKQISETLSYRRQAACTALTDDLGRSPEESIRTELEPLLKYIRFLRKNCRAWCAPRNQSIWKPYCLGGMQKQSSPCGQVLIAARWEYPLLDTLPAVLSAFAAGNRVVLKLSRRTPQSMQFLRWLLENCFSPEEIAVAGDDLPLGTLLRERFDRIWFAGSDSEMQGVLTLAATHRTPVISAPAGRNPVVIGENADLCHAARSIVQSKFLNAGQSSSAADCLYVHRSVRDRFVERLTAELRKQYGVSPLEERTILPLVDVAAYETLCSRIGQGRLLAGGSKDPVRSAVEPTVVDRIPADDPLFTEDFHGPVLPLAVFSSTEELLSRLALLPSVQILYHFGLDSRMRRTLSSAVNARYIMQDRAPLLALAPGNSGLGRRIARELFDSFLNFRTALGPALFRLC